MRTTENQGEGEIAVEQAQTLQAILVCGMVALVLGMVAGVLLRSEVPLTVFPYATMFVSHGIAYAISRAGLRRVAVAVHIGLYLCIATITMYLYGGIRSPAGFVLPPIVLVAGLTWNGRAAIVTALGAALAMATLLVLELRGAIPQAKEPGPVRLAIVIAATLFITSAILDLALRLLARARARLLDEQRARQTLEERLERARALDAVARVTAGVAHDFNNLLTVISGIASALATSRDPVAADSARDIEQAAKGAAGLARLLVAFGRGQSPTPRTIDVNAAIREGEMLLRRVAGENEFVLELGQEVGAVRMDPTQLMQLLLNLVDNANDAIEAPGVITIRTALATAEQPARGPQGPRNRLPQRVVLLQVEDTGAGMTDEVRRRMFEPFFTTKGPERGSGVGLASVAAIVERSHGTIDVASRRGEGTRVSIFLPADMARAASSLA